MHAKEILHEKSCFTDSQIQAILKQAENGTPVAELCREHGMSSAAFYRWRSKYGGMDALLMARMKELEKENSTQAPGHLHDPDGLAANSQLHMDRFFSEFTCVARTGLLRLILLRHTPTSGRVLTVYTGNGEPERCLLIDISPRGMRLERRSSRPLALGSIVTLTAEDLLKRVLPECRAAVLWQDGSFCGLEFETVLPITGDKLKKVVCR